MPADDNQSEPPQSYIIKSPFPNFDVPNISYSQYLATEIQRADPNAIAFINPTKNIHLTYGEFHRKCQEYASALLQLGVTSSDLVLFYADNCIDYAIALIGSIYLGFTFVPVPPANGAYELSQQVSQCDGTILVCGPKQAATVEKIFTSDEYVKCVKKLKLLIQLDFAEGNCALVNDTEMGKGIGVFTFDQIVKMGKGQVLKKIPYFPIQDPERFLICFTSGTTGVPKGAIHSHRSFMASVMNWTGVEDKLTDFPIAIWHPLGHISGTMNLCRALMTSASVVLLPSGDLEYLMQCIEKYKIAVFTFSPNQAGALASEDFEERYDLSSLKYIRTGGSRIPAKLMHAIKARYQVPLNEVYGATEFFLAIRVRHPLDTWHQYRPGNLGVASANVEMKVNDLQTGHSLPPNTHGEICVRGVGCFVGYLNNEEATRNTVDADGWYHSGDVGYYDEGGCVFITDRIKEMIKFRLYSLIPAEIEDFLARHEAVEAVCVVGVPHVTDGSLIRAYVQLCKGKSVTEQELVDYVRENMGSQKQLRAGVRFVDTMPRTLIGKVDRQHFKRLVKNELLTEPVD